MSWKKMFCIVCIGLLITITTIPNAYSITLKEHSNLDIKNETKERERYLGIKFSKLEYDTFEIDGEKIYAVYDAEYSVKNFGDFIYTAPCFILSRVNDPSAVIFYWWYPQHRFDLLLLHGMEKTFSHKIKILSNEIKYYDSHDKDDFEVDERFFAGNNIILTLAGLERSSGPYLDDPNSNINFAKYWNDKPDYTPTLAHLLVSTPWRYQLWNVTTDGNCVEYPFVVKNDDLPETLTQRLGWVWEITIYLSRLTKDIHFILNNESKCFVEDVNNSLYPITKWVIDVCDWFDSLVEDTQNTSVIENLFRGYEDLANVSVSGAINISMLYFGKVIPEVLQLVNDTNDLDNWIKNKSWKQPITVKGVIKNIRRGETISISCRGKTFTFRDEDDGCRDRKVHYEFTVSSEPVNDEENYFEPYNCTLAIEGDRHIKNIVTNGIISYCFSNGTIVKNFGRRDWKSIKHSRERNIKSNNIFYFYKYLKDFIYLDVIKWIEIKK